jgi:hypothetical protein
MDIRNYFPDSKKRKIESVTAADTTSVSIDRTKSARFRARHLFSQSKDQLLI